MATKTYDKKTIADLVDARLPWPEVKTKRHAVDQVELESTAKSVYSKKLPKKDSTQSPV